MADLQISQLEELTATNLSDNDVIAVVDSSASETKKITSKNLIEKGVTLIDAGSIPSTALGTLTSGVVGSSALAAGAVTASALASNSVSSSAIQENAVGSSELADSSVSASSLVSDIDINSKIAGLNITGSSIADSTLTTSKYADTSITYGKLNLNTGDIPGSKISASSITSEQLAGGSVTSVKLGSGSVGSDSLQNNIISNNNISANTIESNCLAANCITSSELSNNSVSTSAIQNSAITTEKVSTNAISSDKLAANLPGSILEDGAISATQLGVNSVTSSSLSNSSVVTDSLADSCVTNEKISSISGTKITEGTLPATSINTSNLGSGLAVSDSKLVINNVVAAGTSAGISYSSQGLIVSATALTSSDLPVSDATNIGAISIPADSGLSVTAEGALSLSNSITATTVSGIEVNSHGLIESIVPLSSSDLPIADSTNLGAVIIASSGGLNIDSTGNLSTSESGVSAGTYQSVTVNSKGVVTAAESLTSAEIPDISASKITSGFLESSRLAPNSISGEKLSNTSTTIFRSIAQLGFPVADFDGQLLYDTVSDDCYIFDGTAWQSITTLTKGSLSFGGSFDARPTDAGGSKMLSVTTAGAAAGLTVGNNLPTASSNMNGVYVVVSVPSGSGQVPASPAPQSTLSVPDYILGVTNSSGSEYVEIDLSSTVASETASNIAVNSTGGISSSDVQSALEELDNEKLSILGGTITRPVTLDSVTASSNSAELLFTGATSNGFETKLTTLDPSQDNTLNLPNVSGNLVSTGDSGTVTSSMIQDGTISNSDISNDAAISLDKLESVPSAHIIVGNSSAKSASVALSGDISIDNVGVTAIGSGKIVNSMVSESAAIAGSKVTSASTTSSGTVLLSSSTNSTAEDKAGTPKAIKDAYDLASSANSTANSAVSSAGDSMTGNLILENGKELRLTEPGSTNYTAIKAGSQDSDITLTLPSAIPGTGKYLMSGSSTSTNLEWGDVSSSDPNAMLKSGGTFTGNVTFEGDDYNALWDKAQSSFELADDAKLTLGSSKDLSLYHDSTHAYIKHIAPGADSKLYIKANNSDDGIVIAKDGSVSIYYDGLLRGSTTSEGFTVNGTLVAGGLTYPNTDGDSENVLTTNGSGALYWSAVSGGSGGSFSNGSSATWNTTGGESAGNSLSASAEFNVMLGYEAGKNSSGVVNSTMVGYQAGLDQTGADHTCLFGYQAGYSANGNGNVYIGYKSGRDGGGSNYNVGVGYQALKKAVYGGDNIAIGRGALEFAGETSSANGNVAIGYNAGGSVTNGDKCVCVGDAAGSYLESSENCIMIGEGSGHTWSPSGKVEDDDNIICMGNEDIENAYIQVSWTVSSDIRDKADQTPFTPGISFIEALNPITYKWDLRSNYPEGVSPDGTHKHNKIELGLSAQELLEAEKVAGYSTSSENMLMVSQGFSDSYGVKYERLILPLINAVKELSAKVKALETAT